MLHAERGSTTIHVSAPSVLSTTASGMPQRSPFAIQELLGLTHHHDVPTSAASAAVAAAVIAATSSASGVHHRSPTAGVSAITPNGYPPRLPNFSAAANDPLGAAARSMYFNAAAAAFLPNVSSAGVVMGHHARGMHEPHVRLEPVPHGLRGAHRDLLADDGAREGLEGVAARAQARVRELPYERSQYLVALRERDLGLVPPRGLHRVAALRARRVRHAHETTTRQATIVNR